MHKLGNDTIQNILVDITLTKQNPLRSIKTHQTGPLRNHSGQKHSVTVNPPAGLQRAGVEETGSASASCDKE